MATPRDNTEVFRMLRDFKDAIYKSATPLEVNSPNFNSYVTSFTARHRSEEVEQSNIATRLNFSNMEDTTNLLLSNSVFEEPFQSQDSLKRKLVSKEAELQVSKASLKGKEAWISMMEPANKKICISLEQQLEQFRRQNEIDKETIKDLRSQLKCALNEAAHAKNRALECDKKKTVECEEFEMKMMTLHQECSSLKLELSAVKSNKAEDIRKLNYEIGRLELKLSAYSREAEQSKEYIQSLKKQVHDLTEKTALSNNLQKELKESELLIKTLENKIEADNDAALVVQARQAELKLIPELQDDIQNLKEELRNYKENNVALFQEKMWNFKEKLAQSGKSNIALAKLQVENEQLKEKISEWEALFDDRSSIGSKSPSAFSRKLSYYQKNEVILANKLAKLSSHCETLEQQNQSLETNIVSLKNSYEQAKQSSSNFEPVVKRMQRRIFLLTKERDNSRKLIDSYASETTMSGAALNDIHVKNLEDTISEYKSSLEKTEAELEKLEQQVKSLIESNKTDMLNSSEVKKLRDEKEQLLSTVEDLKKEKVIFEAKLARQNEVKPVTSEKIIHLRCNPFGSAVQRYTSESQKLRDENDRLRKRIKVLEEEGVGLADITAKVQEKLEKEGSDTLLQSLKDQLTAAEQQKKLIIDTALSKSREFREAIYRLTGYKVDAPSTGQYKLSHVYADSPDDFLIFEVSSNGVQLLETEYSKQLTDKIEMYLQGYDSMPAFLASVTIGLFNQQTYVMAQSR